MNRMKSWIKNSKLKNLNKKNQKKRRKPNGILFVLKFSRSWYVHMAFGVLNAPMKWSNFTTQRTFIKARKYSHSLSHTYAAQHFDDSSHTSAIVQCSLLKFQHKRILTQSAFRQRNRRQSRNIVFRLVLCWKRSISIDSSYWKRRNVQNLRQQLKWNSKNVRKKADFGRI